MSFPSGDKVGSALAPGRLLTMWSKEAVDCRGDFFGSRRQRNRVAEAMATSNSRARRAQIQRDVRSGFWLGGQGIVGCTTSTVGSGEAGVGTTRSSSTARRSNLGIYVPFGIVI